LIHSMLRVQGVQHNLGVQRYHVAGCISGEGVMHCIIYG
jgi:hypothetical protein